MADYLRSADPNACADDFVIAARLDDEVKAVIEWHLAEFGEDADPDSDDGLVADFEHGQWFVTHTPTGAQWSANDLGAGFDNRTASFTGLCFERVSQGDTEV